MAFIYCQITESFLANYLLKMKQMKSRLEKVIDTTEDFVLIFDICEKDWQKRQLFGKNVSK